MRASLRAAAAVPTSVGPLLAVDVGGRPLGRHRALPRRLAHPRAAGARPRRERRRQRREGGRGRAGRRQPGHREPSAGRVHPPTRRRGPAAATPSVRARYPGHPAPVPPDVERRMPTLFPIALGEYLAPGPPDPEHRVATIAFVRFSGTDAVLAQRGPQALAERLHELVTSVEAALEVGGRHAAGHRPRHRRRQVLPRRRRADHPRGRRGPDAARPAADRGCRPFPAAAARGQPRPRLRRRGGRRRARRLLRDGRHDQHRGPHHVHRSAGLDPRAPRRARALPHPVRRHPGRALRDEGQGTAPGRLRRRRGDGHARRGGRRAAAPPRPGRGERHGAAGPRGRPGRRRRRHHRRRSHRDGQVTAGP